MPGTLSKVLQLPTNVPFPRSLDENEDASELQDGGFVSLAVCSEFTEYSAPVQPFEGCQRLSLVSDPLGQPVVFAIGSEQRLHCLVHINGGAHGWKLFDITPEKVDKIKTFDLIEENEEDSDIKVIHIAVAAVSTNGTANIHHASFPLPAATLKSNKVSGFEPQSIKWTAIINNAGLKKISYLLVGPRPSTSASSAPFLITAGSEQQENIAATHYTIDPSSEIEHPWQTFAFSRDADKILEIRPAKLENEFGIYVLFEQQGATECVIDLFGKDGKYTNTRLVLAEKCGKITSMYSNANATRVTDLFLASDKGLGFVNTQKSASSVQTFAENVSFKQVVASEAIDQDSGDTQSKFTIFAVRDQNELHYIQGIRTFKGNKMVFENSGLPIRTSIQQISCQFNAQTNASEVLYLDEQGAALK
ncbi:uncharacterized protein LY89DRAFT_736259 [Mollisia scopiformis]|uniref:Uncharacterized protein n=1 Tax=Mollisia scopiformis TaxID=149040 RepID=A0A194X1Z3_MOLSC|nr:uncharacterized protein LY89DRAFT_736259 [Mollisia scopiformis]KUJ14211.1 hypothetical protein LY89DRAFT_736259 [Mollisia scopiformis]